MRIDYDEVKFIDDDLTPTSQYVYYKGEKIPKISISKTVEEDFKVALGSNAKNEIRNIVTYEIFMHEMNKQCQERNIKFMYDYIISRYDKMWFRRFDYIIKHDWNVRRKRRQKLQAIKEL